MDDPRKHRLNKLKSISKLTHYARLPMNETCIGLIMELVALLEATTIKSDRDIQYHLVELQKERSSYLLNQRRHDIQGQAMCRLAKMVSDAIAVIVGMNVQVVQSESIEKEEYTSVDSSRDNTAFTSNSGDDFWCSTVVKEEVMDDDEALFFSDEEWDDGHKSVERTMGETTKKGPGRPRKREMHEEKSPKKRGRPKKNKMDDIEIVKTNVDSKDENGGLKEEDEKNIGLLTKYSTKGGSKIGMMVEGVVKRKPGRPKKIMELNGKEEHIVRPVKRGRGRPKKNLIM